MDWFSGWGKRTPREPKHSSTRSETPRITVKPVRLQIEERIALFRGELEKRSIDIDVVRALAFQGVPDDPDDPGLRAKYWMVLLNYLPYDTKEWEASLTKSRETYALWKEDLILDPTKFAHKEDDEESETPADTVRDVTHDDHPLSTDDSSVWHAFFTDKNELIFEIKKDVRRTFPHLHFFNHGTTDEDSADSDHYQAILQILFLYAKLNPGIAYVQGMNEILGPIYYTLASNPDDRFRDHVEADAFFCFTNLMAEIRDNFCKTLDGSEHGVRGTMERLGAMLKEKDIKLWKVLDSQEINPQFYGFRWTTLLLSQEFVLPDVLRLWDSFFADPERFEFMLYVCCAMILEVRDILLEGDFANNLKLLQNYSSTGVDVGVLLERAKELRDEDSRKRRVARLRDNTGSG